MSAFSPSWTRATVVAVGALLCGGCVEERPGVSGTTSLRVTITAPSDLGAEDRRLDVGMTPPDVTFTVTALDAGGQVDTSLTATLDVYTQFLGSLSPEPGTLVPPARVDMQDGQASATVTLARVFGPAVLWVEDVARDGATFATGASQTLWYRDPFLVDISRPADENAISALSSSPLQNKQVTVTASQHPAAGVRVVTGIFSQAYSLSDVNCTGTCVADPYAHVLVYTYSRPRASDGTPLVIGHSVATVAGAVQEFNGLTELGFPQTTLASPTPDEASVPAAAVLDPQWLRSVSGPTGMINLERLESALVAVDGGTVCPLDQDFIDYAQWKLDVGFGCGRDAFPVVSQATVPGVVPGDLVGQVVPRVQGILRGLNIGSFNLWIIEPRRPADIQL